MTRVADAKVAAGISVEEFRQRACDWLSRTAVPILPPEYEGRAPLLREWHQALYAAGWVGIHWPREVGGLGLSAHHNLAFNEELAKARAPQPVGSIGLEVIGPTILKYGTAEQRQRIIKPLLAGKEVWCQGFSEPDAGSDLASLRTSARREGDYLIVTGHKVWTSWATDADWCALLVRTRSDADRPHRGITYLLVDMRSPGVSVKPITMLNGDAEFNELFFDEVRVPVSNVLGEIDGGWALAMDSLGWERAGYSIRRRFENEVAFRDLLAALVGVIAEEPLDACALTRLGELHAELKAFEALTRRSAERLASGTVPTPYDSIDKMWLTRTEQALTGLGFDLLGPTRTAPATDHGRRWTKRFLYGRAASVYGGSAQIQRTLVAERLLGLPRGR
ncbi:acyl-CoA dehydrogenase family protein [Rhodococcus sp. NPDC056960]|uniref:acyl-CoA dehydrogenase family protein n=1 Tax=Rhodococcus TaxID=1827 RepID=UPI00364461EF